MKRLLFAILLALPMAAQQTAITNVRLFDGTKVIPHATVLIDGTRIAAAGANVAVPKDAKVIDGNGKTLLPGLIDSHTHVFPGSLERALRFGVTTELDMFTSLPTLDPLRAEQAKGPVTQSRRRLLRGNARHGRRRTWQRVLPDSDVQDAATIRRRSSMRASPKGRTTSS